MTFRLTQIIFESVGCYLPGLASYQNGTDMHGAPGTLGVPFFCSCGTKDFVNLSDSIFDIAAVAELAQHQTRNLEHIGSNPIGGFFCILKALLRSNAGGRLFLLSNAYLGEVAL